MTLGEALGLGRALLGRGDFLADPRGREETRLTDEPVHGESAAPERLFDLGEVDPGGEVAASRIREDVARDPVSLEGLERPPGTGGAVKSARGRPVVEDQKKTPGDPLRERESECVRPWADLEQLARSKDDPTGAQALEQGRGVSAIPFLPFEAGSGFFGSLTPQADEPLEQSLAVEPEGPDGERVEELVGDEEAGDPGRLLEGRDKGGRRTALARAGAPRGGPLDADEPEALLAAKRLGEAGEQLPLPGPHVDDVERSAEFLDEPAGHAREAPREGGVPGGSRDEVALPADPSRSLVVPAVRIVERRLLEEVEAKGTVPSDPLGDSPRQPAHSGRGYQADR